MAFIHPCKKFRAKCFMIPWALPSDLQIQPFCLHTWHQEEERDGGLLLLLISPPILFPHGHINPESGMEMWFIAGHTIVPGESGILLIKVEGRLDIMYTIRDVCQRHCW